MVLGLAGVLTAQEAPPKRTLIVGDSIMRALSHSVQLGIEKIPGVESKAFSSLGSGLARLDVFDWMQKIRDLTAEFPPDSAIVLMGANDRQPILAQKETLQPNQPAWEAEYTRRVGEFMDLLAAGGVKKLYWIELPDMREAVAQENALVIRRLQRAAAETRPFVRLLPSDTVLSRKPGVYSAYVVKPGSMPLMVRDPDGIHLNRPGADLLAEHILSTVWPRP